MLLVYQNKDNTSYAYYYQKHLPHKTTFYSKNNRGQELLLAIIYHKGRVFVVSSENELNKLYQMPVLVRINHFIDYKTNHLRKCLGSYLVRVGKSLNK